MWRLSNSPRHVEPELMDDPSIDPAEHRYALRILSRINWWSGAGRSTWRGVRAVLQQVPEHHEGHASAPNRVYGSDAGGISVLDVATGGGDLLLGVWRHAQRAGIPVGRLIATDISATALQVCRDRLDRELKRASGGSSAEIARCPKTGQIDGESSEERLPHWPEIETIQADLLPSADDIGATDEGPDRKCAHEQGQAPGQIPLPDRSVDVAICSLFLHHLADRNEVAHVLREMVRMSRWGIVVNDLRRTTGGLIATMIVPRILSRSPIVHSDAVISARAAWTAEELMSIAVNEAGLQAERLTIRQIWPWRLMLTYRCE